MNYKALLTSTTVLLAIGGLFSKNSVQAAKKEAAITTYTDTSATPKNANIWKSTKKHTKDIPVQILGINDLHGGLSRTGNAYIGNNKYVQAGSAIRLGSYLNQAQNYFKQHNKNGYTFRVESGDMVGASPSNSVLLQDESTMHALKAMNINIGTLGNHEFDEGLGEFHRIVSGKKPTKTYNSAEMSYPHTSSGLQIAIANVVKRSNNKLPFNWKPYIIKTVKTPNGKKTKIVFIGILTKTMPSLTTYKNYHPYKYLDEATTIAKYDRILRKKGIKAIVVMAHTGVASTVDAQGKATTTGASVDILKKLYKIDPHNSVDVYLAGHSHQYANAKVGHTNLVQAIYSGEAYDNVIGYIDPKTHDFVKNSVKSHVFPVLSAKDDPKVKDDAKVKAIVQDADKRVASIVNQKVGEAANATSFTGRDANNKYQENETGDVVVDAQLAQAKKENRENVDFAMTNGGGVRAGLKVKPNKSITWGAAQDVQPFGNMLYVVAMTGQQIYDVLNQQYKNGRTYLLVSGLKYDFTDNHDPSQPYKVTKVYDNSGKELDLNKKYNVVVNDFLKDGGDDFPQFTQGKVLGTATAEDDTEVLVNYIKDQTKAGHPITVPKLDRKNYIPNK